MAMELTPPFEPDFDVSKPTRQRIPKEQADRPQIDYFCHMVDCNTANPNPHPHPHPNLALALTLTLTLNPALSLALTLVITLTLTLTLT